MADGFSAFSAKLDKIASEFNGPQARSKLDRVGRAAAQDATGVIRSTIGDTSMSHWRRKKPIDLSLKAKVISDHEVQVAPDGRAAGPSRVLNDGRRAAKAGERRLTGKVSKKTGAPLSRKVKRTSGAHGGKHTWDRGLALIEKRTPERVHGEVTTVLRKQFGG